MITTDAGITIYQIGDLAVLNEECPVCRVAELARQARITQEEGRVARREARRTRALDAIKIDALEERYPDPTKRWEITKRTMTLWLVTTGEKDRYARTTYAKWLDTLPAVQSNNDYNERIVEIVQRAETDWERNSGENCTAGTNHFLNDFGLGSTNDFIHETTKTVTVSMEITFTVTNRADEYNTRYDVRDYLRVNVDPESNVDDLDYESVDVSINEVHVEYQD